MIVRALLAVVVIAGCSKPSPDIAPRRARIEALAPQILAALDAADTTRRAGLAAAHAARIEPAADAPRCAAPTSLPLGRPAWNPSRRENFLGLVRMPGVLRGLGINVVPVAAVATAPGPRREFIAERVDAIRKTPDDKLAGEAGEKVVAELEGYAAPQPWTHDLTVVADVYVVPARTGSNSYEQGAVNGTAYLWDYAAARIACVARVTAQSSGAVNTFGVQVKGNPDNPVSAMDLGELENDLQANAGLGALELLTAMP
jgi:hypothetical protein